MNLRGLVESKLMPTKFSVSKSFEVDRQDIDIQASYDPTAKTVAVNVSIHSITQPLSFKMLMGDSADAVDCPVFGTRVTSCGLTPKLGQCAGCSLNTEGEFGGHLDPNIKLPEFSALRKHELSSLA